jgi:glycosyltransferase involved in cell wall biosynthesis
VHNQKRFLDFVPLVETLDRTGIDYQFTFAGHDNSGRILDRVNRHWFWHIIDSKIRILDRLPHSKIPGLLLEQDIFVLLSEFEGCPLSLIEAMACGCVPIVTDIASGVPELIQNGRNGFIIGNRNWEEFAERIQELQKNPERRRQMAEAARATVSSRYSVEQAVAAFDRQLVAVCEEITAGKYHRPASLNWRTSLGDVSPPPNFFRPKHSR